MVGDIGHWIVSLIKLAAAVFLAYFFYTKSGFF